MKPHHWKAVWGLGTNGPTAMLMSERPLWVGKVAEPARRTASASSSVSRGAPS